MKFNKQEEKEILEIHNSYWHNYITGQVEAMIPLLDENYTQVGSAEGEVFSNKKESVQFLYDTIDQVAGNIEMRNRKTTLEQVENTVLIQEFCDLYALTESSWIFYTKFRASTLMQQKGKEWKIIHQHSSFPDTRAEEGQNIAIDKIAEENQQLREAVKRRTVELEQKNQELEINAALERVRSAAIAMRSSSEIGGIIFKLYAELTKLNARLDRCFIMIVNPENSGITWWLSGKEGLLAENGFFIPMNQHPTHLLYLDYCKKRTKKWQYIFGGEEKKAWDEFGFSETDLAKLPLFIKEDMAAVKKIHLSGSSDSFGSLVTGSLEPLADEHQEIISRFTGAFNQAYTRFLDLQKAEAQAREGQIELALERIRARTMAMHKSDEIIDIMSVMFAQFAQLNIRADVTGLNLDYKNDTLNFWMGIQGQTYPAQLQVPYINLPFINRIYEAAKNNEQFISTGCGPEEKDRWVHHLFEHTVSKYAPEETKKILLDAPGLNVSLAMGNNVAFIVGNYSTIPFSEEENFVIKRFNTVFEQSYTRFLDLQKAEVQARESDLEKKRSEELLLNILPREIANELKQFGKSYARKHEQVSILFTDIKGFSTISETLSAEELVNQLDECFRAFDNIVGKHGLEKIKTIGDAYVCACGLPNPDPDNAVKTVRAAIDMLEFAKGFAMTKIIQDLPGFEFRFGIHTGPVITGVVGLKKFTYDIWGDAVNMAARMEQHGEAGKINISGNTYQLVKDKFICTHRGKIAAKNKGDVDMYFVERKKD